MSPVTLWLALHAGSRGDWCGPELVNKKKRDGYRRMPITSPEFSGPFKAEWKNLPLEPSGKIGIWDAEVGGNLMGSLTTDWFSPFCGSRFTLNITKRCLTCGRPESKKCPTCGGNDEQTDHLGQ